MKPIDIEAQRRTNLQIGSLLAACGAVAVAFAMFGILICILQMAAMSLMPTPTTARERQLLAAFSQVQALFLTFMPLQALLGGMLGASGWQVRRGSARAIRIARWTLVGALGWGIAYGARTLVLLSDSNNALADLPPFLAEYRPIVYAIQAVFSVGIIFGPPLLLLFLMRRVRSPLLSITHKCSAEFHSHPCEGVIAC